MNELQKLKQETKRVTITISRKNYNRLNEYGRTTDTFDSVLTKMFEDIARKRD